MGFLLGRATRRDGIGDGGEQESDRQMIIARLRSNRDVEEWNKKKVKMCNICWKGRRGGRKPTSIKPGGSQFGGTDLEMK